MVMNWEFFLQTEKNDCNLYDDTSHKTKLKAEHGMSY